MAEGEDRVRIGGCRAYHGQEVGQRRPEPHPLLEFSQIEVRRQFPEVSLEFPDAAEIRRQVETAEFDEPGNSQAAVHWRHDCPALLGLDRDAVEIPRAFGC